MLNIGRKERSIRTEEIRIALASGAQGIETMIERRKKRRVGREKNSDSNPFNLKIINNQKHDS